MRFCLVTSFFGAHSFGGDAVYVERLAQSLLRRGHQVSVVYSPDAFDAVRGGHPGRSYQAPEGLRIHALRSGLGRLASLWAHQTGRPSASLAAVLRDGEFDVLHFHNVSLIGGPGVFSLPDRGGQAVRLLTAHEHWLVCPLSTLWMFDQQVCERPRCLTCVPAAGRPPQLWRGTSVLARGLEHLDTLIYPSESMLRAHRERGIAAPALHLPHFLPDDWAESAEASGGAVMTDAPPPESPYLVAAGRLVKEKGFQDLIPIMARFPHLELRLAGRGPFEASLRRLAAGLPNVRFLGQLDFPRLAALYRGALALVVPSLLLEPFGFVVLEALSVSTPAIVRRRGALPELVTGSGGGSIYETDDELVAAIQRLDADPQLRQALGAAGRQAVRTIWSEQVHLDRYLALVDELRQRRAVPAAR